MHLIAFNTDIANTKTIITAMLVNFRSFKQKVRHHGKVMKRFLGRLEKNPPRNLDAIAQTIDTEVWTEVGCLTCANCCKSMTPTFTNTDIKRISAHLNMSAGAFKAKWLKYDEDEDWVNVSRPCQFLNLQDNKCSIYEVRPLDCSGFPHLKKRKMTDYLHVHQQNVEYCPATFKMVEKLMERVAVKKY